MANTPSGERRTLAGQIATRARSWDSWSMAGWLPNPDPILKAMGRDISTYRDLRADAHVGGCVRRRKSTVLAMDGTLERDGAPARIHKAIEQILDDLAATTNPDEPGAQPGLETLIGEALDGALYGYQPFEIVWGKVGALMVPQVVQGKPPEWFHFDADNQLRFKAMGSFEGELLPPRKFLLARQDPTYQNPYGFPDLSMVFWPYTFRRAAKFWVSWLERYGGDFLVGKLPRSASPQEYRDLTDSLEAMIQDAVAAIPDDGSVEVMGSGNKGGSTDAHERFLKYWRGEISIALLGSNQGVESSATLASATAALQVTDDIRDRDAEMVERTVNQLIRWIVDVNWPGQSAPCWELSADEGIDKTLAERDDLLVKSGARLTRAYFLRAYDLEEDDLGPEAEPAAPGMPRAAPGAATAPATDAPATDAAPADTTPPVALAGRDGGHVGNAGAFPDLVAPPAALSGPDYAEAQAFRLAAALEPSMLAWVAGIRAELDAAIASGVSASDFAARLLTLYPTLAGGDFTAIMGEALAAADLAGRYDIDHGG